MTATPSRPGALGDLRVIDLVGEIGLYAAKVFTNLGAEVIRVEPPGGDAVRRRSPLLEGVPAPENSLYAAHYHAGKRSVTLDLADPADLDRLRRLLAEADVLLESFPAGEAARLGLDQPRLSRANPGLVVTSVTPFGRTGPWAEYAGTDLTGFASGGMMYLTGEPDQPPVRIGGEQAYHFVGLQAVAGTLAALIRRSVTGRGQHVDVSMQEAIAAAYQDTGVTYYQMNNQIPRRNGTRHLFCVPFAALPCADGYFHWGCVEPHQWWALVDWLAETEDVEALRDPSYGVLINRTPLMDYVNLLLTEFAATRTKAELFAEAERRRLPATPVKTVGDLLDDPHLRARRFFAEIELPAAGRTFEDAGSPFRMTETPGRVGGAAPILGQDNAAILDQPQPVRPPLRRVERPLGRTNGAPQALDGLRVLDFTWAIAGPMITRVLAAHGAEVLKIESGTRLDVMRLLAQHPEQSGGYVNVNAGKRSITIDLTKPEAIPLIKRLVAISDIVVENFSPRVMPKLGLDYETLRRIKPDLIMLSLPGFGAEGPYRDYVSYGPNIMSVSGLTHLTGYPDGPPSGVTFGYGDYVGGINGAVAILAAVYYRDQTGLGQYVNLAQFEAAVAFLGPAVLETKATGREPNRQGNRHPDAAPHGVYPCAGEDRWCAIAVTSDDQWRIFAGVLGRPELAVDARFATLAARKAHEDQLDALIVDWTRPQAAEDVMAICQTAGIAAAVTVTIADLLERDPQIAARGYYEAVDHPHLAGLKIDGATFQLSETPGGYRGAGGGLLGEGNDYVFQDLLGMDEGEIARLMEAGVINRHLATHLQGE